MTIRPGRRQALEAAGAAMVLGALDGCAGNPGQPSQRLSGNSVSLPRLQVSPDRITAITVCTRPFRAQGPRIEAETIGEQTVVHNYGHGGSGWSLSWGSSRIACDLALATGVRKVGVVGCGALGLTSALLLQRAGAEVTIYARELPPQVRSSLATGVWTPDSRICLEAHATPAFKARWETMARQSFQTYQTLLGLPADPVEFYDIYLVSDTSDLRRRPMDPADPRPRFAELQRELIDDLMPARTEFAPGQHPFGARHVRRNTSMMFNLPAYTRLLIGDFLADGGRIAVREFKAPADLATLPERTLINATGYGARALFGDESLIPVRGQLARTIPQTDIHYGLFYRDISFVPRRDGLVFQNVGANDYYGYNDDTAMPDRREAQEAVETIAGLFA